MKTFPTLLLPAALLAGLATTVHRGAAQTVSAPYVVAQFNSMKHHGVAMGFHMGNATFDPDLFDHWQGIARYNTPNGGIPYLFISRRDVETMGNLCTVQMASRNRTGERFRSNRLARDINVEWTEPIASDKIVHTITFNNADTVGHYEHAGAIQIWNNLLVVALEAPHGDSDNGAVAFFDISDPVNPQHLVTDPLDFDDGLGALGLIGEPDGSLLLAVCGWDNAQHVRFYRTTEAELRHPPASRRVCTFIDQWDRTELGDDYDYWHSGFEGTESLQCINLVRDSVDGRLYLLGTRNTLPGGSGEDHVQLWRVDIEGSEFKIRFVSGKHIYASDCHSGQFANGAAAPGVYVSPSGQLILYIAEHDNDGPGGSVKFGEWTNARYNWQERILDDCTGWVELYQDNNGWSDSTPSRSLVFDAADRAKENLENFNFLELSICSLTGFSDQASSVRWCLPVGTSVVLYEHYGFDGDQVVLHGSGGVEQVANLADLNWDDEISSLTFIGFEDLGTDVAVVPEMAPTVTAALGLLGDRCPTVLSIRGGSYPESLVIDQPVRLEAREGVVTIGPALTVH